MKGNKIYISDSESNEKYLLFLIVGIGTILRFWNFPNIPYMHDELSALSRLQFDNLSDVIKYGVMLGDTHPAGVQIFLYLWTAIGGTGEMWVKLPFIFSGIASIWLSYKIGKLWFDGITGLLTAAMVATTQFFIMYSQIARPYSSGLLLTLAMVYFWSKYFFKEKKSLYLILYVISSALAAYNHYFSLLFAAIVGLSSLFFVKSKKDILYLIISGVSIFILFTPHLNIFFSQLMKGETVGVGGWLEKPTPGFVLEYLNYITQFSILTWIAMGIVMLSMILTEGKLKQFTDVLKKRILLILWFLLPIAIGYAYSIIETPVIQFSLLIFSTPYIYIVLFSFHKKVKPLLAIALVLILVMANIYSLIFDRKHYEIFYHQPYQELFSASIIDNPNGKVFIIDDCIPYYHEYYFEKYGSSIPYFTKRNKGIGISEFIDIVKDIKEDKIITHALTGEEIQIVQYNYPYQIGIKQGFNYEIYTFTKEIPADSIHLNPVIAYTNFDIKTGNWNYAQTSVKYDSVSAVYYYLMPDGSEWGPSINLDLNNISNFENGIINAEAELMMADSSGTAFLVGSLYDESDNIFWRSSDYREFKPSPGHFTKVYVSIDLQLALKNKSKNDSTKLQINIWNKDKQELKINSIKISMRPGNINRNGLFRKLN